MPSLSLDPTATALVLIDLQNSVTGLAGAPHATAAVVQRGRQLSDAFRQSGALVVFVRVDLANFVRLEADAPGPAAGTVFPPAASELVAAVGVQPGDVIVTKKHWGAFYGTDLDQQLRRRRITTIVLGGIATNFGVESTARAAAERAYAQVFVEDAMTSVSAEAHAFSVKTILPRLGRVRSTEEVLAALGAGGAERGA